MIQVGRKFHAWPLYDTGAPTGITRTGQRLFDLLPEYVRDADTRDELMRFMASIGDAAHPVAKLINDADPDTSASGTSEPLNPATTPAGWLPWLGWLIGVPVTDMDTTNARWYLSRAGAQAHGSAAGIQAAVQATLTGNRYCLVTTAVGGDPWAIEVQVNSDEVVDSAATLAAAMREKLAGANLYYIFYLYLPSLYKKHASQKDKICHQSFNGYSEDLRSETASTNCRYSRK